VKVRAEKREHSLTGARKHRNEDMVGVCGGLKLYGFRDRKAGVEVWWSGDGEYLSGW
jgi:hypothetical protein